MSLDGITASAENAPRFIYTGQEVDESEGDEVSGAMRIRLLLAVPGISRRGTRHLHSGAILRMMRAFLGWVAVQSHVEAEGEAPCH